MGAGIGVVEGLYERSPAKLRNGLIGGAVGGLVGGFLFDPILALIASNSGMSSRATAFVILGMCIGILIGLVKVVFKEAWLTVLDGYRPGRQLILSDAQTVLGRAEYAALPFMARGDYELEQVHARVIRQPDGRFALEDNQTAQAPGQQRAGQRPGAAQRRRRDPARDELDQVQRASSSGRRGRAGCGVRVHVGRGRTAPRRRGRRSRRSPGAGQAAAPGSPRGWTRPIDGPGSRPPQSGHGASARTRAAAAPAGRAAPALGSRRAPPRAPSPVTAPPPRPATPATPAPRPAPWVPRPSHRPPPRNRRSPPHPGRRRPLRTGRPSVRAAGKRSPKGQNYCIVCDIYF